MFKYRKSILFLILGSLIFALIAGGRFPYFLFYSVLLMAVISYLWVRITVGRLSFFQEVDKSYVHVGEDLEIKTTVSNKSLLPVPYIEVTNDMTRRITGAVPRSRIIYLKPFSSKIISEQLNCRYRGIYSFGPINMYLSDVFGLFSWSKKTGCEGKLFVYPRVAKLYSFPVKPAQTFGTTATNQKVNEDYSSISDIKKYYPGDSFKKIHWKVSARKGSLHTKNFDRSGSAEAHIFLNLYTGDYNNIYRVDIEEKAVECAAAVMYYTLLGNISTGLHANCSKTIYAKGRDVKEFSKFMHELIRVKSDGSVPLIEQLESRSRILPRGASIVLITPCIYRETVNKIIQLKERGFDVIIILITVDNLNEEYDNIISNCGIRMYKVGMSDDVKTSLEG